MSFSSFSFHNFTLASHPLSSPIFTNSSLYPILTKCYRSISGAVVFPVFTITNILFIFPLHILILYIGVQRRRNQRSVHGVIQIRRSDVFIYHMIVMDDVGVLGLVFFSYGICADSQKMITIAVYVFCIFFPGQSLFHCLTCVERYLAVVHPIIYLRQREKGAVRIRNISIGCVWLLCFGWLGVAALYYPYFPTIPFVCLMGFSVVVILYCSLSVLRILIRPGPGEVGRDRDGFGHKSKQRAFHIIMTILGVLILRFVGFFVCFGLVNLVLVSEDLCVLINSGIWLILPSSVVLPLLFLLQARKLPCCRQTTKPG